MLGVIGVLVAIALVIYLAFRGWSIIPASLLCSLVVILTNGAEIWPSLSGSYAEGFKYFIGAFFLIFIFGSLFGKVMGDSGSANAISYKLLNVFGAKRALLVIILSTAILTYGGVNVFVVIFTIYPIAVVLFKEADMPKRLIAGAVALGAGTFSMTALPGTPAIQNLIPAQVLGTPATAAPILGIVASIIMFSLGFWYLSWQSKVAGAKNEHFVPGPNDDMQRLSLTDTEKLPDWKLSFLPLICVIGLIVVLKKIHPIYAVTIALAAGSLLTYVLFWTRIESPLKTLNLGISDSVMALLNTAAIVGFGFVVKNVVAFKSFMHFALSLPFPPLASAACAVNIMAGITGSASGGLTIFMKTMGPAYMNMGIAPDVLHRICSVASGGLDSLPHSGAVITMLMVMGLTHKEGYKDLGVVTVIFPIFATIVIILLALMGVH
ncbi:MAG: GntP family permease [Deltaproteobacteria bacterium]|nr:GntP family permease [Deltaproteobacteria bacterium]